MIFSHTPETTIARIVMVKNGSGRYVKLIQITKTTGLNQLQLLIKYLRYSFYFCFFNC